MLGLYLRKVFVVLRFYIGFEKTLKRYLNSSNWRLYQYIPWGEDNLMPYNVLKKIEADETLTTCQQWNAEVCYGQGVQYDTCKCTAEVKKQIEDFFFENGMQSYFLGACLDFKHFGFCVTLIILSKDGTRITTMLRKEACNCRFTPATAILRRKHVRVLMPLKSTLIYENYLQNPNAHWCGTALRLPHNQTHSVCR